MRAIGLFARQKLNGRMAALLATTALVGVGAVLPGTARAQDATWVGGTPGGLAGSDYNNAVNWSNQAGPPAGTAFFGATASTFNSVALDGTTTVGGWTFEAGALTPGYTFVVGSSVDFTGTGITINGGSAAIINSSTLTFHNTSTAGSAAITNEAHEIGTTQFLDASTAGSAVITNGHRLEFFNNSTAGNATITTGDTGFVNFNNNSTAGSATITNLVDGFLSFNNTSTAGSAAITNAGALNFFSNSTAGNATISNIINPIDTGALNFNNTSTAGSAAITNAGFLNFRDSSTAGGAAITNGAGAITDFSFSSGPHGDHKLTAGSLAGDGTFFLGANELTVGSNNLSTTVTGVIADGGGGGGTGGSLVKTGTGTLTLSGASTYTGGTTIEGGTLQLGSGVTSGSIVGDVVDRGVLAFNRSDALTFGGVISGTGATNQIGPGTTTLTGLNTYTGGTTINAGTLAISADHNVGADTGGLTFNGGRLQFGASFDLANTRAITLNAGGGTFDTDVFNTTVSQAIGGTGPLTKTGFGTLTLSGANTYTGATTIDGGTLAISGSIASSSVTNNGNLIFQGTGTAGSASITNNNFLSFNNNGTAGSASITNNTVVNFNAGTAGSATITNNGTLNFVATGTAGNASITNNSFGRSLFFDSSSGGAARFILNGTGLLDISGLSSSGITAGSIDGDGSVFLGRKNLAVGGNNLSTTFSGVIQDGGGFGGTRGSLKKVGTGTLTLSGVNTYTGVTVVDGGTLAVNGSIATSSLLTVNAGGTLGGNGVVGNTTVSGGMLAPGNSIGLLTVQGNLTFTAASSYMVEVSPSNADRTNVMGTATLGGATVNASFAPGTFVAKQYTILNAAGGVSGGFNGPVNTNLPANFKSSLSYDANNVFLNLALAFVAPPGTGPTGNQQSVGNTITGSFNSNGTIPMVFGGLTSGGLSQISGETATGTQQTTFDAMNLFMGVMTDPFVAGRGEGDFVTGSAAGYADGQAQPRQPNNALAAIVTKAPRPVPFEPRWSVWAAGFGGSQTTDGIAAAGSNNTTSSLSGTAVGADYRFSPDTLAGFALAGGGTNFSVNGLGSGRSDLFQAGAFVRHNAGAAYVSAALAYGWQDITTDRIVTAAGADHLRAEFNANAFSGRVEGGYRFVAPVIGGIGLTPYAAAQVTTFDLPAYAERALSGASTFALAYGAKSVTDPRSELGLRSDRSFALPDAILTLRGRAAWAHDYDPSRAIGATFQTLPGASFVVNGAAQAADSALVTASAEMKWMNGWSAAATFEGEFSDVTESYAGKGVVRYAW